MELPTCGARWLFWMVSNHFFPAECSKRYQLLGGGTEHLAGLAYKSKKKVKNVPNDLSAEQTVPFTRAGRGGGVPAGMREAGVSLNC